MSDEGEMVLAAGGGITMSTSAIVMLTYGIITILANLHWLISPFDGGLATVIPYRLLPEAANRDEVLLVMKSKRQLTMASLYMALSTVQGGLVYCVAAFICPSIAVLVIGILKIGSQIGFGFLWTLKNSEDLGLDTKKFKISMAFQGVAVLAMIIALVLTILGIDASSVPDVVADTNMPVIVVIMIYCTVRILLLLPSLIYPTLNIINVFSEHLPMDKTMILQLTAMWLHTSQRLLFVNAMMIAVVWYAPDATILGWLFVVWGAVHTGYLTYSHYAAKDIGITSNYILPQILFATFCNGAVFMGLMY